MRIEETIKKLIEDHGYVPLMSHIVMCFEEYPNLEDISDKVFEEELFEYYQVLEFGEYLHGHLEQFDEETYYLEIGEDE